MKKTIFISTSIPYVNSSPHIGYALEAIQADVLARYYRIMGYETYFLSGTDENAIKNVEAAEKHKIPIQEFVDKNSQSFFHLKQSLNLSFDQFIRTTSEKHKKGSRKLWNLCLKDIYKKKYSGLYCTGCETFYKDKEFPDNICPEHNRKLELVEEENYFFALSRYTNILKNIYENNSIQVYPDYRKKEVLNYIKEGLEDFSVSRPVTRTKGWGVPVPNDHTQTIYVWFDANANYITALDFDANGRLFQKYWINNKDIVHIIGKNITKFHLLYWTAMLLSAGLPLPSRFYIHGFITIEGKKMSKTLRNVINPENLVAKYGTDAVRYYLLREIPSFNDGNYSQTRMESLYNADLANELGNLMLRITTLAEKDKIKIKKKKYEISFMYTKKERELFESFNFAQILDDIWKEIKNLNRKIDSFSPWQKEQSDRKAFLENMLTQLHQIGIKILPFCPNTAEIILRSTEGSIHKISPLFPKM